MFLTTESQYETTYRTDLNNFTYLDIFTSTVSSYSNVTAKPAENEEYLEFYQHAQFVTGLICYPIICCFGLIGNTLSIIVLTRRKMLTSTNAFLTALAVADTMKLLNDLLYFTLQVLFRVHPQSAYKLLGAMYPVSHYIFNQSVCVASWLTVSLAIERYIYVCHAHKAKALCTVTRARITSAMVFVAMSLLALPSALRYKTTKQPDGITYAIEKTRLGADEAFINVYVWAQNLLRSIIPFFVLVIVNSCIIHALRRQRIPGKRMSARNRITLMLLTVIIVFLICIFPDAIMSTVFGYGYADASNLVKGIREFTDMLLAVNSAVNFIVYCAFSRVFRETFLLIFCRRDGAGDFCWKICLKANAFNQSLSNGRKSIYADANISDCATFNYTECATYAPLNNSDPAKKNQTFL